ncbi:MAG: carbon-nitrogen hydrolase family protein [Planctomycetes bacterium]|nr:carbon-nitrogen hydrolase family protein [Planctomycetota bacterium]
MVLVAAIQVDSTDDEERNWSRAEALARQARARGAEVVALPENLLYEGSDLERRHPLEEWEPRLAALARELEVTLLPGTLREPVEGDPTRAYNTLLAYGPDGARLARYRKIHLFDVDVPGGPSERESEVIAAGAPEPVVVDLPPLGRAGLSVCYDLRFPELFRALVARGARVLFVPASFALMTGKAHWEPLLRARAIENLAWVVAPGQSGRKPNGRLKFGNTMIVDPWGTVVARAREVAEDVVVAEVDLAYQDEVRRAIPCLSHRRL